MNEPAPTSRPSRIVWRPLWFGLIAAGIGLFVLVATMLQRDPWLPSIGYVFGPIVGGALGTVWLRRLKRREASAALRGWIGVATFAAWVTVSVAVVIGIACVLPADQFWERVPVPRAISQSLDFREAFARRTDYPLDQRIADFGEQASATAFAMTLPVGILLVTSLAGGPEQRPTGPSQPPGGAIRNRPLPPIYSAASTCGVVGIAVTPVYLGMTVLGATTWLPYLGWSLGPLLGVLLAGWIYRRQPKATRPEQRQDRILLAFGAAALVAAVTAGSIAAVVPADHHRVTTPPASVSQYEDASMLTRPTYPAGDYPPVDRFASYALFTLVIYGSILAVAMTITGATTPRREHGDADSDSKPIAPSRSNGVVDA